MRRLSVILIMAVPASSAMGRTVDQAPGIQARPVPERLDLQVDTRPETITVHGKTPRFAAAPLPGHRATEGPGASAIYDPKTGAAIGEFGWAYVLAAP
jgi:hypothetical protein